jgi:hypothetical protein
MARYFSEDINKLKVLLTLVALGLLIFDFILVYKIISVININF